MKKWLAYPLALTLLFTSGCGKQNTVEPVTEPSNGTTAPVEIQVDPEMFSDRDQNAQYTANDGVHIQLNGNTATANSNSVRIEGSTITLTAEQTYILSGNLDQGKIVVAAGEKDKPQLVFEGVTINSATSALEITEADKVFITLAEGTENMLTGSEAAVYSKQDLTFNGSGSLTVSSTASHGITCKDDLVFTGGQYTVNSASHGLDANDSVRITGDVSVTVEAGKDGIHCENTDDAEKGFVYVEQGNLKITAQGDGISAGAYANMVSGNFTITAGGGSVNGNKSNSGFFGDFMGGGGGRPTRPRAADNTTAQETTSMKGIKAVGEITLQSGTFLMDTADDTIHSNTGITVNGGSFEISSGDDAFHSDETLTIHGGSFKIKTSYEALEAHKVYVRGGELELHAKDDGINAAGGQDNSGTEGGRDGMFGGGRPGGHFGGGNSDGLIEVSGGSLKIYSSGDCLDANGSITISGGDLYVTNPTSGDTSVLDSDNGAVITGGSFLGAGASTMMAQSFDKTSTQGVIAGTVGSQKAGTLVTVTDTAGNTLVSFEAEYDFVLVVLTTSEMVKGETYTLQVGDLTHTTQAT